MSTQTKYRVLMAGTALDSHGGMSQVERSIIDHWPECQYTLMHLVTHRDGSRLKKAFVFLSAISGFIFQLIQERPQVIHAHFSAGSSILRKSFFLIPAKLLGIKILLHSHTGEMEVSLKSAKWFVRKYVEWVLNLADLLVLTNSSDLPIYMKYYRRCVPVALRNSTEARTERSELQAPTVLCVGSLGERKGTATILDAIPKVLRSFPQTQFVLAGDGAISTFQQMAVEKGISENTKFLGWVDRDNVRALYLSSSVFVLPSLHEGMPVAILEAMSYGLPVISTNVNGIPDVVIDGETGYLIPPGRSDELSSRIIRLLCDDKLRAEFGNNGKRRVEMHFSHPAVCRDLIAIYDGILGVGTTL